MMPFHFWPVATVLLLSACVSKPQTVPATLVTTTSVTPVPAEVVHTARYTLVSLAPDDALRYPLRQVASHTFSATKKTPVLTRGDALRTWLAGTGYGLCLPVSDSTRQLFSSPLPDVQRSPGPLRVENALKMIAGPAWLLSVDEITRTVCFAQVPLTQALS